MTSSYLPPFSATDQDDPSQTAAPERTASSTFDETDHEATYADFLGDQVED